MSHQDCRCDLLVESPVGHINVCATCGHVHLTMQYMTIRFELEAFRALAAMVGEAQYRINAMAAHSSCAAEEPLSGAVH
jgi:predicted lipase